MVKPIFATLLLVFNSSQILWAQSARDTALQWLQQHQKELTYRIQNNEDEGYMKTSFRFLSDGIIEQTMRYGKDKELLSSDEQNWPYGDFQPIGDVSSLAIDTPDGKLGLIRLAMETGLVDIRTGEVIGYPVFELGFPLSDNIAKQTILDAIEALKKLTSQDETSGSADIRKNYKIPEYIICIDNDRRKKWSKTKKPKEIYLQRS